MKASINVKIEQGQFFFQSELVQIKDISFREGFNFVGKALYKYLTMQKLMVSNTKNRPKLSEPFNITIETSDGETYGQRVKIQLPTSLEKVPAFENKLLQICGISILNERDDDFYENIMLIKSGNNPTFPLVNVE